VCVCVCVYREKEREREREKERCVHVYIYLYIYISIYLYQYLHLHIYPVEFLSLTLHELSIVCILNSCFSASLSPPQTLPEESLHLLRIAYLVSPVNFLTPYTNTSRAEHSLYPDFLCFSIFVAAPNAARRIATRPYCVSCFPY